jgi:hypothetical protein
MVDGASILDFAPGPQKVRNGPAGAAATFHQIMTPLYLSLSLTQPGGSVANTVAALAESVPPPQLRAQPRNHPRAEKKVRRRGMAHRG